MAKKKKVTPVSRWTDTAEPSAPTSPAPGQANLDGDQVELDVLTPQGDQSTQEQKDQLLNVSSETPPVQETNSEKLDRQDVLSPQENGATSTPLLDIDPTTTNKETNPQDQPEENSLPNPISSVSVFAFRTVCYKHSFMLPP